MKKDGYEATEVECDNEVVANWDSNNWGINITANPNHVNRIKCSINFEVTLSNYIIAKSEYDDSVVKEEHDTTEQTGDSAKTDYRYIGANPNNYVCLEESGQCTNEQLYRIIGVIPTQSSDKGQYENRIKLVKYTNYTNDSYSEGRIQWSGREGGYNDNWEDSTLNTQVLNVTYWNQISAYHQYIDKTKWYLGSIRESENILTSKFYQNERSSVGGFSSPNTIYTVSNIGLIYPSDFGYATSGNTETNREMCLNKNTFRDGWSLAEGYAECLKNDWIYTGKIAYTLTPAGLNLHKMLYVVLSNGLGTDGPGQPDGWYIYPSFYLKASVKYLSGSGIKSDPYRVTID